MNIWNFCGEQMKYRRVALIIIIDTKGSSPGKVGFKMAVSENGELKGSVGGGSAEYDAVEMARKKLQEHNESPVLVNQIHRDNAVENNSGMICSGDQTYVIYFLSEKDLNTIQELDKSFSLPGKGILKALPEGIFYKEVSETQEQIYSRILSNNYWEYYEPIGLKHILNIFGGGHVSLELSKVMNMLGFYVQVFDNRSEISTMKENEAAHRKIIIDYSKANEYVADGTDNYVVIMTVGHLHDLEILEQMAGKNLKYLGMMGSKSKVGTIHRLLEEKGFTEKQISMIHMPIGEPIHSHTPMEIAISISAQIVKIKNTK